MYILWARNSRDAYYGMLVTSCLYPPLVPMSHAKENIFNEKKKEKYSRLFRPSFKVAFSSPPLSRKPKLQLTTEQPTAEGHWNTTKKTYPMSKDKGEIAMR